jgi:succinoglycan biosynthesis protein ExoV
VKLYFYRGAAPNFGDELNQWLMPKVFLDFFDDDPQVLFLGIGSVLFDHHPATARKIVFGSGYGGYTAAPRFDHNWRVYCVRGPRTARLCGLSADTVAGDSAILIRQFRPPSMQTGPCSFIPHWESLGRGHWQEACRLAGVRLIDPCKPVETILGEIEDSQFVICEAMHGAIVCDSLRVPWIPILPFHESHRMKWFDWAEALNIDLNQQRLWPSSLREAVLCLPNRPRRLRGAGESISGGLRSLLDAFFVRAAAKSLRDVAKGAPMLSRDSSMDRTLDRLQTHAAQIKKDFPLAGAGI